MLCGVGWAGGRCGAGAGRDGVRLAGGWGWGVGVRSRGGRVRREYALDTLYILHGLAGWGECSGARATSCARVRVDASIPAFDFPIKYALGNISTRAGSASRCHRPSRLSLLSFIILLYPNLQSPSAPPHPSSSHHTHPLHHASLPTAPHPTRQPSHRLVKEGGRVVVGGHSKTLFIHLTCTSALV